MILPNWDEVKGRQRQVLDHPLSEHLFVIGPPGSGKTLLAIQRMTMLAEADKAVLLVTYNRMLRRLASLLHSSSADERTLHTHMYKDYPARTGAEPPQLTKYNFNWDEILLQLSKVSVRHFFSHVVVDEAQDLPEGSFKYLRATSQVLNIFADEDQALEDHKTTLEDIAAAAGLSEAIVLQDNYRNVPEVAAIAEHYHSGRLPPATIKRKAIGERPVFLQCRNFSEVSTRIKDWFDVRGGTLGVIVDQNDTGKYLCRTLSDSLPSARVDFYEGSKCNEDGIELREPGITILNTKSVKGQEFDTVFILEVERFLPCRSDAMRRAMYMMCARARDYLRIVHVGSPKPGVLAALPPPSLLEREL